MLLGRATLAPGEVPDRLHDRGFAPRTALPSPSQTFECSSVKLRILVALLLES